MWIGAQLRRLRKENKHSQKHLGGVAGMCQSDMSNMENGELDPGFHAVLIMLRYMNARVSDVVEDDGRPAKP